MPRQKRDTSGWTKPRQFRLGDDTLAEIDWLAGRFKIEGRSAVIRQAVRRWALAEGRAPNGPAPGRRRPKE